ncbi:MAG: hypothetical protein SP4CHLAM5_00350 [Chlamydiia bacterium]|nr:hypothetical protein [Chlamydiia bacterium]MCH9617912.1 hypothetical protein [Chlamydiia bacterium]MCH9624128.1 hypothetical protein [Chlamydiia bacterium]
MVNPTSPLTASSVANTPPSSGTRDFNKRSVQLVLARNIYPNCFFYRSKASRVFSRMVCENPISQAPQGNQKKYVKIEWFGSGIILGGIAHPYTNKDTIGGLIDRLTGYLLGPKGSAYTGYDLSLAEEEDVDGNPHFTSLERSHPLHSIAYKTDILNLVILKRNISDSASVVIRNLSYVLNNNPSQDQIERIFEIIDKMPDVQQKFSLILKIDLTFPRYRNRTLEVVLNMEDHYIRMEHLSSRLMLPQITQQQVGKVLDCILQNIEENLLDEFHPVCINIRRYLEHRGLDPASMNKILDIIIQMDTSNFSSVFFMKLLSREDFPVGIKDCRILTLIKRASGVDQWQMLNAIFQKHCFGTSEKKAQLIEVQEFIDQVLEAETLNNRVKGPLIRFREKITQDGS